jgi:RNA polymerase sigma factor (sigma-70 family)
MPDRPLQSVMHHLRRVVSREGAGDLSDAQLVDDFVRRRDEAAFELLVWRHAGLVLGVCQRLLHDRHEAEDAFQATFLVLVRKAASLSKRESVGAWLHKVACRIARRARTRAAKRPCGALPGDDMPARKPTDEVLWRDLRPVLDEEVNRLPEKYRRPFVLCYLEGNTNEQAARQLGCPKGTVLSRLARGRERLRARLARRGLALPAGLLAALLIDRVAEAAVPAALVSVIVKAATPFAAGGAAAGLVSARAAAWTEGVLRAMFLTKLKLVTAAALVVALAATGAGLLTQPSRADSRPAQAEKNRRPEAAKDERGTRAAPQPQVQGIVKAVDADKGTITLTLRPGRGEEEAEEKTFTLTRTTEVGIGTGLGRRGASYREGKVTDLAPGAVAVLQLADDQKTVECVLAEGPAVRGVIKAVDAGKGTITVTVPQSRRGEGDDEKTFTVGKDAEIAVDDGRGKSFSLKEAKLAELPAGAVVLLRLSVDSKQVQSLLAEGPTVQGTVKAVDAGKRQITLTTRTGGRGEPDEEQTYTVAAGAEVLLDDGKARRFVLSREGKLADLPAGSVAALKLSPDQKEAMTVRAEGPTVYGLLKVTDPSKHTITLTLRVARGDNPGEDKTFAVAPDARVVIDGKEGKLADLKADDNGPPVGLKLSLDQKAVQSITVGGRR